MTIAGVEVRLICRPCFRKQHARCERTATYQPARGPLVVVPCECAVQR